MEQEEQYQLSISSDLVTPVTTLLHCNVLQPLTLSFRIFTFSIQFHQSLILSLTWYCITGALLLDQCLWCRDLIADKTDLIISLPPPPGSQLLVPGPLTPRLAQPILASHWSTLRRPGKIETLLSSDWLMGGVTTSILMTLVRQKMLLLFWMSSFV